MRNLDATLIVWPEGISRRRVSLEEGAVESVWISAARNLGLELLGRAVAERLSHGVQRMRLMTDNPRKIAGLQGYGLTIAELLPLHVRPGCAS